MPSEMSTYRLCQYVACGLDIMCGRCVFGSEMWYPVGLVGFAFYDLGSIVAFEREAVSVFGGR